MQRFVSGVRQRSTSYAHIQEEPEHNPGDNCADVRDAIEDRRIALARGHGRSQSAQISQGHPPPLDIPIVMAAHASAQPNRGGSGGGNDANYRQLKDYTHELQVRVDGLEFNPARSGSVEAVFQQYSYMREQGMALCKALLGQSPRRSKHPYIRTTSATSTAISPDVTSTVVEADGARLTRRATTAMGEAVALETTRQANLRTRPSPEMNVPVVWLNAVGEWKQCIAQLATSHKTSLAKTYTRYDPFATPAVVEGLLANWQRRQQDLNGWMRELGAYKRMQSQPEVFARWQIQLGHYDRLVQDVIEVECYLANEDPIPMGPQLPREVLEHTITSRGDAILEFANTSLDWKPILRFRVSSHLLAETSPLFARMFAGSVLEGDGLDGADVDSHDELPPAPTLFTYPDGSTVNIYTMPQMEQNREGALTLLLQAAHMRNSLIPREISFSLFVAIAEAAIKYRCTSPLELFVEHRWLPQWLHMAQEEMPAGLVTISYAFGLRRLFTRATKTVVLNLVDQEELAAKAWPEKVKEKIWQLRCAKMAQVYATCTAALEDYLRPTAPVASDDEETLGSSGCEDESVSPTCMTPSSPSRASLSPTMTSLVLRMSPSLGGQPRCPKGNQWCDATNLGWLMLLYNQLNLLGPVLQSQTLAPSVSTLQVRSLQQVIDALRSMASPPSPVHPGRTVCDPVPAFKAAINDIYNSVNGLTLYDVDGKRHGWALSRKRRFEPQMVLRTDLISLASGIDTEPEESDPFFDTEETLAADPEVKRNIALEALGNEHVARQIMETLDSFDDLHSLALVNWGLYATFKEHELGLMRRIVRADRRKTMMALMGEVSRSDSGKRPSDTSSSLDSLVVKIGMATMEEAVVRQERLRSDASSEGGRGNLGESQRASQAGLHSSTSESDDSFDTAHVRNSSCHTAFESERPESVASPVSPSPTYQTVDDPGPTLYSDMTMEEAHRILWPEDKSPLMLDGDGYLEDDCRQIPRTSQGGPEESTHPTRASHKTADGTALESVKFRFGEDAAAEGKSLVHLDYKQLTEEYDLQLRPVL